MLGSANLSLEQAPPLSIPFRFFLTAPLFAVAAGLLALAAGPELLASRWSAVTLAVTHLLTLGFLTMVMGGAVTQILPVLAGSPLPRVRLVGSLFHLLLTLGTGFLVAAFLLGDWHLMLLALGLLGVGFGLFLVAFAIALLRVRQPGATVVGMWLALVALLVTVLIGLALGAGLFSLAGISRLLELTDLHLAWGVLGWVGLLLLAVAYQVVPMFQVTPEYPAWLKRIGAWGILGGLLAWTLLRQTVGDGLFSDVAIVVVLALFLLFALMTLRLQAQRKRRIRDVTLVFWRTGMISIVVGIAVWGVARLVPAVADSTQYPLLVGVLLLLGAGESVINGMLYKIVPFLSWFHLQNRQLALMCLSVQVPNMKQLISERMARIQFQFHLATLLLAVMAVFFPEWLVWPAALLLIGSNLLLLANLIFAVRRYRVTDRLFQAEQLRQSAGVP